MENAWLDSLSEDWISQPRSEGSPTGSLPALAQSTASSVSDNRATSSRIPLRKSLATKNFDSSDLPLSERSANDNNIPLSQRSVRYPTKLRNELSLRSRGRKLSRTASASTTNSVQHNTIQHKSLSVSPQKSRHTIETPEWKRRLLHGEVAYGEQRDLFSPAGLENIFRPPPPSQNQVSSNQPKRSGREESVIMPSSPPLYARDVSAVNPPLSDDTPESNNRPGKKEPRAMKYKLADSDVELLSEDDRSEDRSFSPVQQIAENSKLAHESDQTIDETLDTSLKSVIRPVDTGRTVSGQSDIRHEDLSPIFISRHSTIDGNIDYVALDMPATVLQQRLHEMGIANTVESSRIEHTNPIPLRESIANNTADFARNGRFVNLGRGGYSEEGSFQKRMLSSSSVRPIDESGILLEESVQASTPKQLPQIRKTRASNEHEQASVGSMSQELPGGTPRMVAKDASPTVKPASGSPLKLFGTYDTFTNQKLLRRLSQFENSLPDDSTQDNIENLDPASMAESTKYTEMNEAYIVPSSPSKASRPQQASGGSVRSELLSTFGDGNLDQFEFSGSASFNSNEGQDLDEGNISLQFPKIDPRESFRFKLQPSPTLENGTVNRKSSRFTAVTTNDAVITVRTGNGQESAKLDYRQHGSHSEDAGTTVDTPRKHYGENENKRLPHSPLKDPTPKRRRTLQRADFSNSPFDDQVVDSVRESHQHMQSIISKKRKDARHGDNQQPADPEVMATRQILRPRNPTPNQRSTRDHGQTAVGKSSSSSERISQLEQQQKIARVQAELDATAAPLKASLGIGHSMHDESRKGSVTTQDFLDEAKKIMAGIRGKARRSGLNSVEESENENDKQAHSLSQQEEQEGEDSFQESTQEPFSRPPSRDGAPVSRLPQKQQDPEVLSHLRKYEEMSDLDGMIASSMKSLGLAREVVNAANEMNRLADERINSASSSKVNLEQPYQSDPPNIQITERPEAQRKRKHSTSSIPTTADDHNETGFPSTGSNSSSGQSTGRSIPTGSSRGSESRRVIAAHTVAHLIPEQLAGMVFDRERRIWVKSKNGSDEKQSQNILLSDDDDPFGDIPDLTVDETQELQRIKAVAARKREEARNSEVQGYSGKQVEEEDVTTHSQPKTLNSADKQDSLESMELSQPSNFTRLASGTTAQDTRLTSWEEHPSTSSKSSQSVNRTHKTASEVLEEVEEFEEEISIHESRSGPRNTPRRRNVTISFSSPLASIIEPESYDNGGDSDNGDGFSEEVLQIKNSGNRKMSYSTKTRSTHRTASRRMSIGGHSFLARPISRIDEREEGSISEHVESNQRSVSVVISTPVVQRSNPDEIATLAPSSIGILQLSPLSDFTVNQPDESFAFEVSYIGRQQHHQANATTRRSLSLSIKDLVRGITDIEPYEPFWEHLKEINLRSKRLQSLHMLSKFCGKLEDLQVSDNEIRQLDGAPDTIRHLQITHNLLSDLSSWHHLRNLQYIDVSNNELTSLDGFKDLVHLRSLRADNNKIASINGILGLDGLISLRLRDNLVETIDFGGALLQRLTDLDLKGNSIRSVQNLHELRSLNTLNLEDNQLSTFTRGHSEVMWTLKYLKLGGNMLEVMDVSLYPNLRLLYLDRNRLVRVNGLLGTKHLDSLSLREQQEGSSLDLTFLNEAFEVRKLFLSGNYLPSFAPTVDYLNLQYLELANCGLESLPIEFGQMMSNIRVLNLNFNALRDIRPLIGIVRLKRLHLAGNRLFRLRKTANVLAQFSTLSRVDLRNNPLTLGFYPPVTEKRIVVRPSLDEDSENVVLDQFILADADKEKDAAYAGRLDMETRMRRRVFEMLTLGGCTRLRILDGLKVDRVSMEIRDKVWQALSAAGLVDSSIENMHDSAVEVAHDPEVAIQQINAEVFEQKDRGMELGGAEGALGVEEKVDIVEFEERWGAEDSFA